MAACQSQQPSRSGPDGGVVGRLGGDDSAGAATLFTWVCSAIPASPLALRTRRQRVKAWIAVCSAEAAVRWDDLPAMLACIGIGTGERSMSEDGKSSP